MDKPSEKKVTYVTKPTRRGNSMMIKATKELKLIGLGEDEFVTVTLTPAKGGNDET